MMRILCVAEKNDVAKTVSRILSKGQATRRESRSKFNKIYELRLPFRNMANCDFSFTSVSGHLMKFAFPTQFSDWERTPMQQLFHAPLERLIIDDGNHSMKLIGETLKDEARRADVLIIWTDCDREGEGIGYEIVHVCQEVNRNLDVLRAKFSELTAAAINRAMQNLVRLDQRIVDAVDCRSELDLRLGAAFTRHQTLKLRAAFPNRIDHKSVISYGSCQFPTMGFVVERYKAIQAFVSEPFWKITVKHRRNNQDVEFVWERVRLFEKDVVEIMMDMVREAEFGRITGIVKKPKSRWRPTALDTVELEKLAVRKLRMSAKSAMEIAERLYQQGFISYPRTETNKFPPELDLASFIEQQTANDQWGAFAQEILNRGIHPRNGDKTDQAHPPIHPIKFAANGAALPRPGDWPVYELVVRHFLACCSRDATGQETKVQLEVGGEQFIATGLVITDYGFLDVFPYDRWTGQLLPEYRDGEQLRDLRPEMSEGRTTAPQLLSEADLIALMDKHGIGTDATHAEHIQKIMERNYAGMQQDRRILPGYLGLALVDGYEDMGFTMSKPDLRANLEADLKLICEGRKAKQQVLTEQLAIYERIFVESERKVQMLIDAFGRHTANVPVPALANGNAIQQLHPVVPQQALAPAFAIPPDAVGRGGRGGRGRGTRGRAGANNTTRGGRGGGARNNAAPLSPVQQNNVNLMCLCGVPAVGRIVRKESENKGRQFFGCAKNMGEPGRCNFFQWADANT